MPLVMGFELKKVVSSGPLFDIFSLGFFLIYLNIKTVFNILTEF